jgi:hypothetical protein
VVRSGKLRRKPFNSNVADDLLIIATLAAGRPADHRMSISLTNGRKLGAYITSNRRSHFLQRIVAIAKRHPVLLRVDSIATSRKEWSRSRQAFGGARQPRA